MTLIVCDAACIGLVIGILTLLAMLGVPGSCRGLAKHDSAPRPSLPPSWLPPYGDRQDDDEEWEKRSLFGRDEASHVIERFCIPERIFYVLAVVLMWVLFHPQLSGS